MVAGSVEPSPPHAAVGVSLIDSAASQILGHAETHPALKNNDDLYTRLVVKAAMVQAPAACETGIVARNVDLRSPRE